MEIKAYMEKNKLKCNVKYSDSLYLNVGKDKVAKCRLI